MKKQLRGAAISGLISLILTIVFIPIMFAMGESSAGNILSLIFGLVSGFFGLIFFRGFLVLGKKFNINMLTVLTWIAIGFLIIGMIFTLLVNIIGLMTVAGAQGTLEDKLQSGGIFNGDIEAKQADSDFNLEDGSLDDALAEFAILIVVMIILVWLGISITFGVFSILFGIAERKMTDKVPYSGTAGMLNIIAGATYIIFVGFLIRMVAFVFEVAMFFKASEKYEK
jgi:hypothetical protein